MGDLIFLIINAALVNNLVLFYLIGVQDQTSFSKRFDVAWNMSIAIFCIVSLSVPVNYITDRLLITGLGLEYMSVVIYMMNIFIIVQACNHVLIKLLPTYQELITSIKPLVLLTSVILGAVLVNFELTDGFFSSLLFGTGTGAGFGLVLLMFTCLRERINTEQVPVTFRELPILLVTLAIMSMAFTGLTGVGA